VIWLVRWSSLTAVWTAETDDIWEEHVLRPAEELAPYLVGGRTYLDRLVERCDALRGERIPLVATHNDLNMKNVFLDASGGPGIIDWVTGRDRGLPLADFYYAILDAVIVTQGYREHLRAYARCFSPAGDHRDLVNELEQDLVGTLQVGDAVRDLCFHACWLHHAANQLRFSGPEGHFVQIAQRLARREVRGREEAGL
jgi:hypothetical protein